MKETQRGPLSIYIQVQRGNQPVEKSQLAWEVPQEVSSRGHPKEMESEDFTEEGTWELDLKVGVQ